VSHASPSPDSCTSRTLQPDAHRSGRFAAQSLIFGPALIDEWRDAHHEVGGFLAGAAAYGFDVVPLLMAWATPSGPSPRPV